MPLLVYYMLCPNYVLLDLIKLLLCSISLDRQILSTHTIDGPAFLEQPRSDCAYPGLPVSPSLASDASVGHYHLLCPSAILRVSPLSYELNSQSDWPSQLGVEFGSKLITIPEEDNKVIKLQCTLQ